MKVKRVQCKHCKKMVVLEPCDEPRWRAWSKFLESGFLRRCAGRCPSCREHNLVLRKGKPKGAKS